ncbi:DNA cross-link repair protein PSO2/SNM1 [Mycena chlorophos]|uniref:DNA cross-link repair protein PSO2/SNM1 n=1 Tax=Mycena chlorophos TaxID=658473 RepID=A0A8H6T016_MYCCL|nr:DNA cross-link repair protein PSO2/SNM1 [Mycena chlorophos]
MRSSSIVVSDPAVVLPGRGPRGPTRINDRADTYLGLSLRPPPSAPRSINAALFGASSKETNPRTSNVQHTTKVPFLHHHLFPFPLILHRRGSCDADTRRVWFANSTSTHLGFAHVVVDRPGNYGLTHVPQIATPHRQRCSVVVCGPFAYSPPSFKAAVTGAETRRLGSQAIPADSPYLPIQPESLLVLVRVGGVDCTNGHAAVARRCKAASTGSASKKEDVLQPKKPAPAPTEIIVLDSDTDSEVEVVVAKKRKLVAGSSIEFVHGDGELTPRPAKRVSLPPAELSFGKPTLLLVDPCRAESQSPDEGVQAEASVVYEDDWGTGDDEMRAEEEETDETSPIDDVASLVCPLCQLSLSDLSETARQSHVNACLDADSAPPKAGPSKLKPLSTLPVPCGQPSKNNAFWFS